MKKYLKPAVGLLIVGYVLRSKIVDFEALREVAFAPMALAIGMAFQVLLNGILAARWYLLCRAQALPIRLSRIVQIQWTSSFLSLVLPGAVGVDLVKGWYVVGAAAERKHVAALTIFVDRVVGSTMLFLVSAGSLLFFREQILQQAQLQALARVVWVVTGSLILGGTVFLVLPHDLVAKFPLPALGRKAVDAAFSYRRQRTAVSGAAALAVANVFASVALYAIQAKVMAIPLAPSHFLLVVPLASLASYFGFLPLGLGVGQVVFYQMFSWLGVARPETGAALCTLIQLHTLLFNLSGSLGFLRYRRERATSSAPAGALRRAS